MNRHTRIFAALALALGTLPVGTLADAAIDTPFPTTSATLAVNRHSVIAAGIL